jgi:hypothetical protein
LEGLNRFVANSSQKSTITMFRSGTVFSLPLGRAEKVCGNLLAKIDSYNVQEQCSHCHLEELKRLLATFSQIPLLQCLGTVSTTLVGRAEKIIGNLLAKIAVAMFRNSVHTAT